jgi:hypothetical protein
METVQHELKNFILVSEGKRFIAMLLLLKFVNKFETPILSTKKHKIYPLPFLPSCHNHELISLIPTTTTTTT